MRQWLRIAFPRNYLDRRKRAGFLFVLPALLFFGSVFILPLAQSIMYSFYKIAPGGAREFVGLRLYEKVLTDPTFWSAVQNTVQLLLFSVPTTVILALAVALGLNRISNLKWRNVWASMYFLPFATSLVAAALIWQWIYDPVYGTTQGGPAGASQTIIMLLYDTAFKYFRFGDASVMAVFVFITLMTVTLLQWRIFRKPIEF